MNLRPMLAASNLTDLDSLRFPLLASPKLDGIRCLIVNGQAVSRNLKPIPNQHIQSLLSRSMFDGLDGELIVGPASSPTCMRDTNSGVMSRDGTPAFKFYVFDRWDSNDPFHVRTHISNFTSFPSYIVQHYHQIVQSVSDLEQFEQFALTSGYEGLILRDPAGQYKFGRSTLREGGMIKLKRFLDAEAIVLGVEELQRNFNEATTDNLGLTHRSTHAENKMGGSLMGSLQVRNREGVVFNIGSGFTMAEREQLWNSRDTLPGRVVKYKYFPTGSKERPRFPVFLGFRSTRDL